MRMLHVILYYIVLLCWGYLTLNLEASAERKINIGPGKVGYWVSSNSNSVFDDIVLGFMTDHAGLIVLNLPLEGHIPSYNYSKLVQRVKALKPNLPVLFYTWSNRWHDSKNIGTSTLTGYPKLGTLLLHSSEGRVLQLQEGKLLFGDVRKGNYHSWLVEKVRTMLKKTGTDGVALDMSIRTPFEIPAGLCTRDPNFCEAYAEGMDSLFSTLQNKLYPKIVIYNGIWNLRDGMLEDQQKLLDFTDAAAIEFFGMIPFRNNEIPSFEKDILPYLKVMQSSPDKIFLVFGRGPEHYINYQDDYLWQRYLYCAYLLAAGPNTLFKYHASFSIPPHAGRSGGLDTYADWEIELGNPISNYIQSEGVYQRHFTNGLVLLVPYDSEEKIYSLPRPMFTPEGKQLADTVTVKPGQGLLLLFNAPELSKSILINFKNPEFGNTSWRWSEVRNNIENKHFLHFFRTPKGDEWEHDLMLDPVRSLQPKPTLIIKIRTYDKSAKLLFVAEVDDIRKQHTYAVVEVTPRTKPGQLVTTDKAIHFRMNMGGKYPYIPAGFRLKVDGKWDAVSIMGDRIFSKTNRYIFRRWSFIRVIGDVEIDDIEIRRDNSLT